MVEYSWRLSILIQAGLELPILITLLFFVDNIDIDILEYSQKKLGRKATNNELEKSSYENFKVKKKIISNISQIWFLDFNGQ